ncbi:MAG: tryptophan synthase subunit alpha [Eubacteriales bacterium]
MKKIADAFNHGTAFVAFITCGDPDLETTKELIHALARGGTDLIELGIPFSDPTAEGETIQNANMRALAGGVNTEKIFKMLETVEVDIPLVFMTYANVVFHYGIEKFAKRCSEVGISGLILPDIPYEEKEEFAPLCQAHGVDFVSFVAPTSEQRIAMIAKEAKGFVYCVSSLGVTGVRSEISVDVPSVVAQVKSNTDTPVAVGFGISTPEQGAEIGKYADGIIVGSAIVKIVEAEGKNSPNKVEAFARKMKKALE